jgi:CRISPR-associated protein Csy2
MSYILINCIKVQNANAIAGFTWGFPAITHFLGFTHHLERKITNTDFDDIHFKGCAVICHEHQVNTYGSSFNLQFTQSRNPPYLKAHEQSKPPPVIEEGKMNMTVSLLIGCEGNIGNKADSFKNWLNKACQIQRLAGGTVLSIENIDIFSEDLENLKRVKFKLLPGFILMDRSIELENHYQSLLQNNSQTELLDAWLDFSALKHKARPQSNLISKHLKASTDLLPIWLEHQVFPYEKENIPQELKEYFNQLEPNQNNKELLGQWQNYCEPDEKIEADWEYIPKPAGGYLVPIMTGYKAISKVHKNEEVANTRDNETDVCFVESVHSLGEWKSVHRIKDLTELNECLWNYHYEENWYLCKQGGNNRTEVSSAGLETEHDYEEDFS